MAEARTLTLYLRTYCHLCDDMRLALAPWRERYGFSVEEIDVDDHPEHEDRWGDLVPALAERGEEICHYFLDEAALRRHLET